MSGLSRSLAPDLFIALPSVDYSPINRLLLLFFLSPRLPLLSPDGALQLF